MGSEASDFVAELKRKHRRERSLLRTLDVGWRSPGSPIARIRAGLKTYFREDDRHQFIYRRIAQALPEEIRARISDGCVILAGIHDPVPEAYVRFFSDDSCAIVYNFGLMDFMYRVCRAFAAHFTAPASKAPDQLVASDGARIIAEIFWWYQQTGKSFGPNYQLGSPQMIVAARLVFAAEAFFLAHEFGHVLFRIRAGKPMSTEAEELQADAFALEILAEAIRTGGFEKIPDVVIWLGIQIGLLIFAALERLGSDFGTTHPAFSDRLEQFRAAVASELKDTGLERQVFDIGEEIESSFSEIVRIALAPSAFEQEFYQEQERQAAAAFRGLVDECANYPRGNPQLLTADHQHFAAGMTSLMNAGYAYVLVEEVKKMAAENAELMDALGNPEQGKQDDALVLSWALAYNRIRVLSLWSAETIEPARTLFSNAIRDASKAARTALKRAPKSVHK